MALTQLLEPVDDKLWAGLACRKKPMTVIVTRAGFSTKFTYSIMILL